MEIYVTPLDERERGEKKSETEFLYDCEGRV